MPVPPAALVDNLALVAAASLQSAAPIPLFALPLDLENAFLSALFDVFGQVHETENILLHY